MSTAVPLDERTLHEDPRPRAVEGVAAASLPRRHALCEHTFRTPDTLVVEYATLARRRAVDDVALLVFPRDPVGGDVGGEHRAD